MINHDQGMMSQGEWLQLDAAAKLAGVSPATARRHLGHLPLDAVRRVRYGEWPGVGRKGALLVRADAVGGLAGRPRRKSSAQPRSSDECNLQLARPPRKNREPPPRAIDSDTPWTPTVVAEVPANGYGDVIVISTISRGNGARVQLTRWVGVDGTNRRIQSSQYRKVAMTEESVAQVVRAMRAAAGDASGSGVARDPYVLVDGATLLHDKYSNGVAVIPFYGTTVGAQCYALQQVVHARPKRGWAASVTMEPAIAIAAADELMRIANVEP